MYNRFTFKKNYFILTILLFVIEILIAVYVHDKIIRPYIGDFLVVILMYCFIKTFFRISVPLACIIVLLFSFTIEILQYFHLVKLLGLQNSKLACIVLGTSFQWIDLLAYTLGVVFVWWVEKVRMKEAVRGNI